MSDIGNGHDTEIRLLRLEKDVTRLAAGDLAILEELRRVSNASIERHNEVMRMVGEVLDRLPARLRRVAKR